MGNGLDALTLTLRAYKEMDFMDDDDEVIVPALTFIATASAVIMAGAEPVFVDVSLVDCNILSEQIESMISKKPYQRRANCSAIVSSGKKK